MSEEIEPTGTLLEHRVAQTTAEIIEIDAQVTALQEQAEALRAHQVELRFILKKLTAIEVAEPEEPVPP